jgi:hypothetical protein
MDRLTPLAPASAAKDQPRSVRKFFTRPPKCRWMASAGAAPAAGLAPVTLAAAFRRAGRTAMLSSSPGPGPGKSCAGLFDIPEIHLA